MIFGGFELFVTLSWLVIVSKVSYGDEGCHYELNTAKGVIKSPGSPKYKDDLTCTWKISVPHGNKIVLNTKSFKLESSYNCESDALYIYDGPDEKSPLYSKPYCDINKPTGVVSRSNSLFLKFITDNSYSEKGFEIHYQSEKVCDFEFRQSNGSFTSPNFPLQYYENANCSYRIITKKNNAIKLTFHDFFLENEVSGKCLDFVAIYDVISGSPKLLKKRCGVGIPRSITSSSNEILVKFHSDSLLNSRGFNASFDTVFYHCENNHFKCSNGKCMHVSFLCNGVNDCLDNTDEIYCKCTRFQCNNRKCISDSYVCNGANNCGDWSDELHCNQGERIVTVATTVRKTTSVATTTISPATTTTTEPPCPYSYFTCKNKRCIEPTLRCDGDDHCGDDSDESDCSGQCRNLNGGCHHVCKDDPVAGVQCSCNEGFVLDYNRRECIDVNECSSRPCAEICTNIFGSFKCSCNKGYRLAADGYNCTDYDECSSFKHLCEQKCLNTIGSYMCTCFDGFVYHSEKKACVDVDECALENGGCAEKCVNTVGKFHCECNKPGYSRTPGKTYCEETNECELGTASCAQDCVNTDGSYLCKCGTGYRLDYDGHNCVDINECLEGAIQGCWGNCINTLGSYRCDCDIGFREIHNNTRCEDINECESSNGGCSNVCINSKGSFKCKCSPGYIARDPHSFTCYDEDECEKDPCDHNCINTPGSFECVCKQGFRLANKSKCIDIDECQVDAGGCSGTCTNTYGSYICTCADGFILDSDKRTCIKEVNGTGCRRLKINSTTILESRWSNVTTGWAWQAGISVDFPGILNIPRHKCMGVLVHEEFVLTTSHCVKFAHISINPEKILISLGSYEYGYRSAKVNVHGKAIFFKKNLDLALIHLNKRVRISKNIQPLCLPQKEHVNTALGQKLVTVMWPYRRLSNRLQHIKTTIDTVNACKWNGKYIFSFRDSLCVRFRLPENQRMLPPSGTPLLGALRGTDLALKKQKWYLTGLLVYGDGYPGNRKTMSPVYHHVGYYKVSMFSDWIKKTIDRTRNQ